LTNELSYYCKAFINGKLYHTTSYRPRRVMRRNNYTVLLEDGDIVQLLFFVCMYDNSVPIYLALCSVVKTSDFKRVIVSSSIRCVSSPSTTDANNDSSLRVIFITSMSKKCVYIDEEFSSFLCILPNNIEGD